MKVTQIPYLVIISILCLSGCSNFELDALEDETGEKSAAEDATSLEKLRVPMVLTFKKMNSTIEIPNAIGFSAYGSRFSIYSELLIP